MRGKADCSNYVKLEFPSRSAAAQLDPTLDELGDIKTAVSEAVTNAIVHAYPEELGVIFLRARIVRGDTL